MCLAPAVAPDIVGVNGFFCADNALIVNAEDGEFFVVVGIRSPHDGALLRCHAVGERLFPIMLGGCNFFCGSLPGRRSAGVFVEDGSALVFCLPGQGAVRLRAVHEKEDISRFHSGLNEYIHVAFEVLEVRRGAR